MQKSPSSDAGCLGLLLLVAPFVADAIDKRLVVPTLIGSAALVALVGLAQWIRGWGHEGWRRAKAAAWVAFGLAALTAPVWAGMSERAGAQYVILTLALGGLWLGYWLVRKAVGR